MRSPPAALIPLLAVAGLVINALNYGLIWWPLRYLQGWGLHPMWATVMVDALACAGIFVLFPRIWRAFLAHRWLWLLALAAGGTNVGFSWGVVIGDVRLGKRLGSRSSLRRGLWGWRRQGCCRCYHGLDGCGWAPPHSDRRCRCMVVTTTGVARDDTYSRGA